MTLMISFDLRNLANWISPYLYKHINAKHAYVDIAFRKLLFISFSMSIGYIFKINPYQLNISMIHWLFSLYFSIFTISYLSRSATSLDDQIYLSLNSDWDLDEAFQNASEPILQLKVTKVINEGKTTHDMITNKIANDNTLLADKFVQWMQYTSIITL